MAQVVLHSIRKSYGNVEVIHGVDVDIEAGEFIVIVGPSGCGKSTLLRMIAGLEAITGGHLSIAGTRMNDVEPKDRGIAMVFQNYALYPHMSVFANMAYGLKIMKLPQAEIQVRVDAAAKILQLEPFLERRPGQLSGGQRQRVAMGRAIVREPDVFLFDEPLSNLDAKLRAQMRLEIKRLHSDLNVTSVFVTHDQVEAMTMADRLIVMNAGIAEQIGTPLEVYKTPATKHVAGFIGSPAMNFFEGIWNEDGVTLSTGLFVPMSRKPTAQQKGSQVFFGIRPEHVVVSSHGASKSTMEIRAEMIEHLGAETLVHGMHKGLPVTVVLGADADVQSGQDLHCDFAEENYHLFDMATEMRL